MEYASIEHSRKLARFFSEAEWWWITHAESDCEFIDSKDFIGSSRDDGLCQSLYPAITTDMALEVLRKPGRLVITQHEDRTGYDLRFYYFKESDKRTTCYPNTKDMFDKSLPNALCKMIQHLADQGIIKEARLMSNQNRKGGEDGYK